MAPSQYVQKPYKVLAEQYLAATPAPDATPRAGLCGCTACPVFADGRPHVHGATTVTAVTVGDWIVQAQWSPHDWFVIPDAEFQDRF
jgi:hypothetical protein